MPQMSRIIEGCAYNPEVAVLAFRFKDMAIVVERDTIHIHKVRDEAETQLVIDWLASVINGGDDNVMKQEVE